MNNMAITWNGTYNDDKQGNKNTKLHGQWASKKKKKKNIYIYIYCTLPLIKALSMCNNVLGILDGMDQ